MIRWFREGQHFTIGFRFFRRDLIVVVYWGRAD